jgi:Ca-activated chloride channel family protein
MNKIICRVFLCLSVYLVVGGQIWRDNTSRRNAEGNEYYRQKVYSGALEKYVEAQDYKRPRPEISYNIANTLYQEKKYSEAQKEFEKSISKGNRDLDQRVYFNRGNNFYQMGQYQAAVEAYQKTLELDPKDRDAKHNLELALRMLKENPQQQKFNSSDKDQKKQQESPRTNQEPSKSRDRQEKSQGQTSQNDHKEANSKTQPEKSNQSPAEQPRKGMDSREALQILDAINDQEKKEQRKQVLKLQRAHVSGRDW